MPPLGTLELLKSTTAILRLRNSHPPYGAALRIPGPPHHQILNFGIEGDFKDTSPRSNVNCISIQL